MTLAQQVYAAVTDVRDRRLAVAHQQRHDG